MGDVKILPTDYEGINKLVDQIIKEK